MQSVFATRRKTRKKLILSTFALIFACIIFGFLCNLYFSKKKKPIEPEKQIAPFFILKRKKPQSETGILIDNETLKTILLRSFDYKRLKDEKVYVGQLFEMCLELDNLEKYPEIKNVIEEKSMLFYKTNFPTLYRKVTGTLKDVCSGPARSIVKKELKKYKKEMQLYKVIKKKLSSATLLKYKTITKRINFDEFDETLMSDINSDSNDSNDFDPNYPTTPRIKRIKK
ncbi:hypothetical protein NUSPORA_01513 [Nucleospora cyclopteri]